MTKKEPCVARELTEVLCSKEGCALMAPDTRKLQEINLHKSKNKVPEVWNIAFSVWKSRLPGLQPPRIFICGSKMAN